MFEKNDHLVINYLSGLIGVCNASFRCNYRNHSFFGKMWSEFLTIFPISIHDNDCSEE